MKARGGVGNKRQGSILLTLHKKYITVKYAPDIFHAGLTREDFVIPANAGGDTPETGFA
jgi:hypothetical protein